MKPILLKRPFFPERSANRMKREGDVVAARSEFIAKRPNNLSYLLGKRYSWMNRFIGVDLIGVELGSGPGFAEMFIETDNLLISDVIANDWVDVKTDAMNMAFADSSLDYIICSNIIHHLAFPQSFFQECYRVLKPQGLVIIQEINASFLMRFILRLMRHEGYSFNADVYQIDKPCNDAGDPWSANCAIPNLLFDDDSRFESMFPFKIIFHEFSECFIFLLSGGVVAKTRTVNLPHSALRIIDKFDDALISMFPQIFGLQRKIVLRKSILSNAKSSSNQN